MDNISSWVRQARHRAKKHEVPSSLTIFEATDVLSYYNHVCAYCGKPGETLDHAMPLSEGGPNVQGNIMPCCRHCKFLKRNRSLVWMFGEGMISEEKYIELVGHMLSRSGADDVRTILRRAVGYISEDNNG